MFRLIIPCLVLMLSACTTSRVADDVEPGAINHGCPTTFSKSCTNTFSW
ncbi:hypothetical protein ACOBV8_04020 [Pseudoalteromonas espejiana]